MTVALKEPGRGTELNFAAIFHEYAPFVLRAMRHLGVAAADVQDQSQEVFVAIHQGIERFAGRSSLRTWIYGICLRVASNYRRRAYIRRERAFSEPPEPAAVHDPFASDANWAALRQLLDTLDDEKREVFVLYELEELTMREVADVCGCPLQTAYSRLRAARRVLLEKYKADEVVK